MPLDFYNWFFVFLRVGAFLFVLPFFSATNFPVMLRIALAALVGVLLSPLLPVFPFPGPDLIALVGLMAKEVCIGLLLGFVSRTVFYAVDLAGNVIATEMALNMAAIFNPLTRESTQAPGMILFFLAAVVMLTLDLHHWILLGFERTYVVLPIGGAHLNSALFEAVLKHSSSIFIVALQISAPIIAVSFVVLLVFSVLSRAVPQMNVFAESFGFRIVCGLVVFGFTLHLTAQHVLNGLRRLPDDLLVVGQLLGMK